MVSHPFIGDLSNKTLDELLETITKLNKQQQYMFRLGKAEMVNQIGMAIASFQNEYNKRQKDMWDKKTQQGMDKKIDIS